MSRAPRGSASAGRACSWCRPTPSDRPASFDARSVGIGRSRDAREIDEAPLDVRAYELHAHPVADVDPLEPADDLPFHRRPEHTRPRPLDRRAGPDRVEPLADPWPQVLAPRGPP